jgi:hypothetical protein
MHVLPTPSERASYTAIDRRQTTRGQLSRQSAALPPCQVMRITFPSGLGHYRQTTRPSEPARVSQVVRGR